MNDFSFADVDQLFEQTLEHPLDQQDAFLQKACPNNSALRQQIEKLLQNHRKLGSFLEKPAEQVRDSLYANISENWKSDTESRVGSQIAKYTIVKELGRGGGSTVYEGQRQEQDWQQSSAIKILRRGIDTDDVLRRFHSERQILAHLNHPGIASIHDAGVTDDGLPWFAMDLIDGKNIDDYCQANSLSLKKRLRLFLQVLDVVNYAHQHLIVHRDIKPSNILVSAESKVKLLDFGISKVLEGFDDEIMQIYTRTGVNPATPSYAAPEQLTGSGITTATDIYQLGLLLCKLLTGTLPVSKDVANQIDTRNRIKTPSELKSKIAEISTGQLKGDLDTIILKALRVEPQHRYHSIHAFTGDILRFLQDQPIEAHPPSLGYRTKKFFKRHSWSLPVGLVAIIAISSYVFTINQYNAELKTERDLKIVEAKRAESIKSFLVSFLKAPDPYEGEGFDVTMKQALDNASAKVQVELEKQPLLQAEVYGTLATVYENLDLHEDAAELWNLQLGQISKSEKSLEELILRSKIAYSEHYFTNYKTSLEQLAEVSKDLLTNFPDSTVELARTMAYRGQIEKTNGDLNVAIDYLEQAIAHARKTSPSNKQLLSDALVSAGQVYSEKGQFEKAFEEFDEAENILRQLEGENSISSIKVSVAKADTLARRRIKPNQALAIYKKAYDIFRETLGPSHEETITALSNTAYIYNWLKQHEKAATIYRESLTIKQQKYPHQKNKSIALAQISLATTLSYLNQNQEAADLLIEARETMATLVQPGHFQLGYADMTLAHIYELLKNYSKMEIVAKRALDLFDPVMARGRSVREAAQCRYAAALIYQGKTEKGKALLQDAIIALEKNNGSENIFTECKDYLTIEQD